MKKIAPFFVHYPESNKAYQTSDEMVFFRENNAVAHASNLEDKKVVEYERDEEEVQDAIEEYNSSPVNQDEISESVEEALLSAVSETTAPVEEAATEEATPPAEEATAPEAPKAKAPAKKKVK
jgi:predicted nucleic acid-binding protein